MQLVESNKSWYSYPLVWMMIAIPFSAVIMGVIMIWLAVDTDDGLVADDYYKQGLAINDVISLDKKAEELQLNAIIEFDSNNKVIKVQLDKGLLAQYPDTLQFSFQHATRANSDVTVTLNHGMGNQYIGYMDKLISEGVWYFEVSNKGAAAEEWKLNARNHIGPHNVIKLNSEY